MTPEIEYASGICYPLNDLQIELLREAGLLDREYTKHYLAERLSKIKLEESQLKLERIFLINQGSGDVSLTIRGIEDTVETEN